MTFYNDQYHFKTFKGEIMVKGAKGGKVKVFFQELDVTHVIFALIYNLKFYILDTSFSTAF
jgi:hypothetical protein